MYNTHIHTYIHLSFWVTAISNLIILLLLCIIFVSVPLLGLLLPKGEHGIVNGHNDTSACCSHKSKIGTKKSAQVIWSHTKMFHNPAWPGIKPLPLVSPNGHRWPHFLFHTLHTVTCDRLRLLSMAMGMRNGTTLLARVSLGMPNLLPSNATLWIPKK